MSNLVKRRFSIFLLLGIIIMVISFIVISRTRLNDQPNSADAPDSTTDIECYTAPAKKCIVLLTTCARRADGQDEARIHLYETQIRQWLERTSLTIVVVESSNTGFPNLPPHPRLVVLAFDDHVPSGSSSTISEWVSMQYAIDAYLRNHTKPDDYILKVTGRYFLDGVEAHANAIVADATSPSIFVQTHGGLGWRNSEYFLMTFSNFQVFVQSHFLHSCQAKLMEQCLADFIRDKTIGVLGPYPNMIPRGGLGDVLTELWVASP